MADTVAQPHTSRNLTRIPTDALAAQRDWFVALLAQGTASALVPGLLVEAEAELARRSTQHRDVLASIVQRPVWAQVKP